MVHVCKLSGPQRDLQLPPETVAYLLPCLRQRCSQGVFFYRGTAMAEFQHVNSNCMIEPEIRKSRELHAMLGLKLLLR